MFTGLADKKLHYVDALTYITIRSFNNTQTQECYPAIDTIAEIMCMSRWFVIQSMKRLVNDGYMIKQNRFKKSNVYFFAGFPITDKIPVEVLTLDLSAYEKAMLVLLRQCCVGTRINVEGDVKQIAEKLGLSYKTVYTQLTSLIEKGYVEKLPNRKRSDIFIYRLTSLLDWIYNTDFQDIKYSFYPKIAVSETLLLVV
jgi:DNA-binding transcriptional ArsR family regulator